MCCLEKRLCNKHALIENDVSVYSRYKVFGIYWTAVTNLQLSIGSLYTNNAEFLVPFEVGCFIDLILRL